MRHNEFILTGYRINFNRFRHLFRSLFMIHNETVNIHTHFAGFLVFIIITIVLTCSDYTQFQRASLVMDNYKISMLSLEDFCSNLLKQTSSMQASTDQVESFE